MVKQIKPPLLEFGNGKRATEPVRAFAQIECPPYQVPSSLADGIEIIPITPDTGDLHILLNNLLADVKQGVIGAKYPRGKYRAFEDIYGVKIAIGSLETYSNLDEMKSIIEKVSKKRDLKKVILAIAIKERTSDCGFYQISKIHAIHHNVRSQFFTGSKLDEYSSLNADNKGEFLWNVSLAFFSKLDGIPWKLLDPLRGVRSVIGLNTVIEKLAGKYQKTGITALQVWNDWGECIGSFHTAHNNLTRVRGKIEGINPSSIDEILRPALSIISELPPFENGEKSEKILVFHTSDIYANEILDSIENHCLNAGFSSFKILQIRKRSIHYQYNPSSTGSQAPWVGIWDYIIPDKRAYLYTIGAWKYYSGIPYSRIAYPLTPIEITLVRGSTGTTLDEFDLMHVFELTRLAYYTADIVRLKMPISIDLGRRGAELVRCGLNSLSLPLSFLY